MLALKVCFLFSLKMYCINESDNKSLFKSINCLHFTISKSVLFKPYNARLKWGPDSNILDSFDRIKQSLNWFLHPLSQDYTFFIFFFVVPYAVKDFFWELFMLIYGNLIYLKNWKISSDKILKLTFRFFTGCWFLWVQSFLGVEFFYT